MRLSREEARAALPQVDPGRVRSGRPVGLRDGALLALVIAGLSSKEIADLKASEITMAGGRLVLSNCGADADRPVILSIHLGGRLLAWLSERRLWAVPEPVFGPLTSHGVRQVLARYRRALRLRKRQSPRSAG
jgi:hypothetical protein